MKYIDRFLNQITMYRLVLYVLIFLIGVAVVLSTFKLLPYDPVTLILSSLFLVAVSWITNTIFAKVWQAPTNLESVYITALILALIVSPQVSIENFFMLFWVAVLSQASKYILAIKNKHLFNPAALAVVLTAVFANQSATWWVGTASMFPFVLISGLLIVRKIQREDLMFSFFITALTVIVSLNLFKGIAPQVALQKALIESPILFFAFVMLTEPLTTPPTKNLQMVYGVITGVLFCPQIHIGSFYTTPELALIFGNIYTYLVSPKNKLILKLKQKIQLTPDTYDFVFTSKKRLDFSPGQYMEWTLSHKSPDSRGNRRYFTLASSPTESDIHLGVKFYPHSSSFKKSLSLMKEGDVIVASQLAGDFTLPKDTDRKLAFIAGGIGITPFRSMFKALADINQRRDVVLLYSNRNIDEIAYKEDLDIAAQKLGSRIIYTLTDTTSTPASWPGKTGRINGDLIKSEIPDYQNRIFYISGPQSFVGATRQLLVDLGHKKDQIVTDFFPGFA